MKISLKLLTEKYQTGTPANYTLAQWPTTLVCRSKYIKTPISKDEIPWQTTNQLTHLKVQQFHIKQKVQYLE